MRKVWGFENEPFWGFSNTGFGWPFGASFFLTGGGARIREMVFIFGGGIQAFWGV